MSQDLPENPTKTRYVQIGKAAEILGVSIDTVRRWDKAGKLHSVRLDGKNRYFAISELERAEESKPLKISEAAEALGVSASTLRRREKEGLLVPGRGNAGERLYTKESLELLSKRKGEVVVKTAEPVAVEPVERAEAVVKEPKASQIVIKLPRWKGLGVKRGLSYGFRALKPLAKSPGLAFVAGMILMMMNLNMMMSKFMTQYGPRSGGEAAAEVQVLGAESEKQGIFSRIGSWFGKLRLSVTREYKQVIKREEVIEDINEVFVQTEVEDEIAPIKTLVITEASLLKIKETEMIENLNAEFLQGKEPGDEVGDIPVFGESNRIAALRISASNLYGVISGGTGGAIVDASITTADLADSLITSVKISDGAIAEADLASDAVTAEKIKDGEVKEAELADGAVTAAKISDNAVSADDLAGTLELSDGDLLDLSAIDHSTTDKMGLILPNVSSASPSSPASEEGYLAYDTASNSVLVYDGSSWSEIGGSITLATSGTSANTASNSGLELTSGELAMLRGCTDAQILKWNDTSEEWKCSLDVGVGGAGISTVQEANVDKITSATQMDFTNDFNVTDAGGGEAGIALDYAASGLNRKGQPDTVTGGWTFDTAATTFNTDVDLSLAAAENLTVSNTTMTTADLLAITATVANTNTADALQITITDDTSTGTARGLVIETGDGAASLDAALAINHTDTGQAMTAGISITGAGSTTITTAIDVSDAEIGTALAIGSNDITTSGGTIITSTELDIVDSGISLAELSNVGTDTATTGYIQVADGNSWESVAMDGDVTIISTGATTIGANKILESHLKAVDEPAEEECLTYESAGGGDFEWQPCGGGSSVWSDLETPTGVLSVAHAEWATTFTWNTADTAAAFDGITLALTNDATTDANTQRVLVVANNDAAGATATERLLVLDNKDTDEAVTTALEILASSTGTITTAIDVSDAEIATARGDDYYLN